MEMISEENHQYNSHIEWINKLKAEYKELVEENIVFSPNTRTRNIKNIWNIERKMPPSLERQSCMNFEM